MSAFTMLKVDYNISKLLSLTGFFSKVLVERSWRTEVTMRKRSFIGALSRPEGSTWGSPRVDIVLDEIFLVPYTRLWVRNILV